MGLLNQIIAIEKGIKARIYSEITELHKLCKKPDLFNGFHKAYQKLNDNDPELLPPESKLVQFTVKDMLTTLSTKSAELLSVTARKDWSNMSATADVVLDSTTILSDVPVTYLIFLEKQLVDIRTFVESLPTLDSADSWTFDVNSGLYNTSEIKTHRTKKVQKALVLLEPTPQHPGQAQIIVEDTLVGHWAQVKHSSAMPKPKKAALLGRVDTLLNAVKEAREKANSGEEASNTPDVGKAVFGYLLRD